MGGGEIARYFGKYGSKGVSKAVIISGVPTLIIHGDEDRVVPLVVSGQRTAKLIKGARLLVIKGGPHCITWTHADEVNAGLLDFIQS
jgi:pimeloyl-ACP methyl ester carboxylesterase